MKQLIKKIMTGPQICKVGSRYTGKATCLMYHSIVDKEYGPHDFCPNLPLLVRVDDFDRQIRFLAENYRCIDAVSAVKRLRQGTLEERTAIITFDDGYGDNLKAALPILEKYNVPATVFVTTSFADKTRSPWWHELEKVMAEADSLSLVIDEKEIRYRIPDACTKYNAFISISDLMMKLDPARQDEVLFNLEQQVGGKARTYDGMLDWNGVISLDKHPLITIGSHAKTHPVMTTLDDQAVESEVVSSRLMLQEKLGHPVELFCYPYGGRGQAGQREFQVVEKTGYLAAFTTRSGHLFPEHKNYMMALPRIAVGFLDGMVGFKWKLFGFESMRRNFRNPVVHF